MIQDILPSRLDNQYRFTKPDYRSAILHFSNGAVLYHNDQHFPSLSDFGTSISDQQFIYLFSIDEQSYFLLNSDSELSINKCSYIKVRQLRDTVCKKDCFAASTALHLHQWYSANKFCGKCGKALVHDKHQRMLTCSCGNLIFPKIAPAVIVCVLDQERKKILMTKYANREYTRYALVAGFTEIGETLEETVAREVFEETGIKVKNIRYYKSQPWGFDSNLLAGFFADLDGSSEITLDNKELSVAEWLPVDQTVAKDDGISLTREMIGVARNFINQ